MMRDHLSGCLAAVVWLAAVPTSGWAAQSVANPSGTPSAQEQKALDLLVSEIQGEIVYTRFTGQPAWGSDPPEKWVVEKIVIGQWKPIPLGPGRTACWSPDGKKIAVSAPDPRKWQDDSVKVKTGFIWIMNADGTGRRQVADDVLVGGDNARMMYWHPNGKEIVYCRAIPGSTRQLGDGVWALDLATGKLRDFFPDWKDDRGRPQNCNWIFAEPQLSADGRFFASRMLPGAKPLIVIDVEKQTNIIYGNGCCASISPDGNWMTNNKDGHNRMIIHNRDGVHRIYATSEGAQPGGKWDNPTWSNHTDYITCKGDGSPKEVFVFKVSEKRWTRVTFDGMHKDYPHLFITNADKVPPFRIVDVPESSGTWQTATKWPADTKDLLFVWADGATANSVPGTAGAPPRNCEVTMKGFACLARGYVMKTYGPGEGTGRFEAEGDAGTALAAACRKNGAFSLEIVMTLGGNSGGVIVSHGPASGTPNFALRQENNQWMHWIRFSQRAAQTPPDGATTQLLLAEGLNQPIHLIVSYSANVLTTYVNGKQVSQTRAIKGDLSNWTDGKLVFGSLPDGKEPWAGCLEGIAAYGRPIGQKEAARKFELYATRLKKARTPLEPIQVIAKLVEVPAMPDPKDAAKWDYPRCLAEYRYEVTSVRSRAGADLKGKTITVVHWVILDTQSLPSMASRKVGQSYQLWLEPFPANEQLSSEKRIDIAVPGVDDAVPYFAAGEGGEVALTPTEFPSSAKP